MKSLIKFLLNTFPRKHLIRLSYVFRIVSQYTNKGNNVECTVCGSMYKKFLGYGYNHVRDNALCPKCLSLERHRLVWLYLKEKTSFFDKALKVLHIAPEQCFEERFRKLKNLQYITADLESPLANYKCDVQQLPFNEGEFDVVICNHVLEHVDDDKKAILEILRVMKPGAFAILLVPNDFTLEKTFQDPSITSQKDRALHYQQYDHKRLYGTDYLGILAQLGFIVPPKNYLDELSNETKLRYALPANEFMFGYKKPG